MTNREKKDVLNRYREIRTELDALHEERREWMDRATRITPAMNGMPGGGSERGALENNAIKLVEIERDIDAQIRQGYAVIREIRAAINAVPDPTLRSLLRMHYINGLRFESIAERLHYSVRWTLRLHRRALDLVDVESVH